MLATRGDLLTVGLATAAVGAAVGVIIGRWCGSPHALLRLRLRLARSSFIMGNVHVPSALLPSSLSPTLLPDSEGLVRCDVCVERGKIVAVTPRSDPTPRRMRGGEIDMKGAVVVACWADAHTHMVKTHGHPRSRNPTGSISDALATEVDDQPRWAACRCCRPIAFGRGGAASAAADNDDACVPCPNARDVERRMEFALASAYHHGTRAVRTHLDGTAAEDAKTRATVYAAFRACRARWAPRGLAVQGVANLYLPLWRIKALADKHVAEAVAYEGVLLGAYCGNTAETPEAETAEALDALFGYAQAHGGLMVDLHIDETNDERCCCLLSLTLALRRARAAGYSGRVLLGHCTALALQPSARRDEVICALATLGAVTVVCNPATNLGLQDRRGSQAPHCAPIDARVPRTPLWRGLTLIQELAAAGVRVGAASDNVRDWWHPYGDYDGLANYKGAITMAHLDTAPNEGAWAALVSDAPAEAMDLSPSPEGCAFGRGAAADLVVFPDARRATPLRALTRAPLHRRSQSPRT